MKMPRYYKDKIFDKEEKQMLGEYANNILENQYLKELEELRITHGENAEKYYWERLRNTHDQIRIKSKKLNQF